MSYRNQNTNQGDIQLINGSSSNFTNMQSADFVIVSKNEESFTESMKTPCYQKFILNLKQEGLLLKEIQDDEFHFTIVTANKNTLQRYAEILKLRLPIKDVGFATQLALKPDSITISDL